MSDGKSLRGKFGFSEYLLAMTDEADALKMDRQTERYIRRIGRVARGIEFPAPFPRKRKVYACAFYQSKLNI